MGLRDGGAPTQSREMPGWRVCTVLGREVRAVEDGAGGGGSRSRTVGPARCPRLGKRGHPLVGFPPQRNVPLGP